MVVLLVDRLAVWMVAMKVDEMAALLVAWMELE